MDMQRLLRAAVQFNASDLHIQVGSQPMVRVDGVMLAMDLPAVSPEEIQQLVAQVAEKPQMERIENERSCDFSYFIPEVARFRINIFYEQGRLCLVARAIPLKIKPFEELFLPPVIQEIAEEPRGLVLVTGTTGSGKSTTLAAIIDYLNRNHRLRIITIEDPIEFVHTSQKSLIAQREIGRDSPSFTESLRRALRQDPDVILVGELRDLETMRIALQAADTGHLVFSTVHTTNAALTLQRLIAMFPANERELLLTQLSTNLSAVISQRLAKHKTKGRIPVVEIMRNTPVIRKAILEARVSSLPQAIANRDNDMQLFDQHLADLYHSGEISGTEALRLATNPDAVALAMKGITTLDTGAGLVR
ncbi:MAG: PilT/PilU family type 4a pilus ATPase [Thermoguttaceae bacterium]|jgi:twitching motility protein PilT